MEGGMLKVFRCGEYDWYAAENAEQAARLYLEQIGDELEELPDELTDEELDKEFPEFDEDESPTGGMTTFRKMLAEHGTEPGWLCGTE